MTKTHSSRGGMVVAPHHLASDAGQRVFVDGGNAIEAIIAAAAAIAVVYPHMNSLGGDNFFLIGDGGTPLAIDACGGAAAAATLDYYQSCGAILIPSRGPQAALTVAGVASGWQAALEESARLVAIHFRCPVCTSRLPHPPINHPKPQRAPYESKRPAAFDGGSR